jgi:hypothetical protein
MDMTLRRIVSDLMVNLAHPLSEVSELPFERLIDGTIVGKIRGMSCRKVVGNSVYY